MYLRLLYFSIHWIKIPDGYQIAGLEELGLWSTSQSSLWIWSLCLKIGVDFLLSILWGYFSFTNTLCNKYLILPLFVAICEIWLPGLTYSVYLVLPLKPGATDISVLKIQWANTGCSRSGTFGTIWAKTGMFHLKLLINFLSLSIAG